MFVTKILALLALVSWLGATGERLYDCWSNDTAPRAQAEPVKSEGWSLSQFRW